MTPSTGPRPAPRISTVVFDLGNVLIGWDPYRAFEGRMTRDEWARFAEESHFSALNAMADAGIPLEEVVRRATDENPQHGEIVRQYFERFAESLTGPVPGVADIVDDLAESDVRLLGLTNWSAETIHLAPRAAPAVGRLEAVTVSGREGVCKPDPEIFLRLISAHGLEPTETVFIDDNPDNVRAAADLGFTAVRFGDAPLLRADLQRLGLLP